ncbi:TadE-like protein [Desulfocapsa sulfexigens DSM 10523]|uniref:TadE-like protein n=2 Tax=Desulfocapsa TaxID=53318 RepID=M1NAG7_DESSD|nr:TadE-like protein [Desulfocapsa sulfexigens DSM 10523]
MAMNLQKTNRHRPDFSFQARLLSNSGQSMAEFLIILPVMLLLIFGAIQFALIYHAKITLNYAAFEAVRAGTLGQGKFDEVKEGFARGLAPLYSYFESDPDLRKKRDPNATAGDQIEAFQMARDKIYKEFDTSSKLIRIERLNPSDTTFLSFASDATLPNDNLRYRSSKTKGKEQVSLQDANLLHLRVTYWYPLYVPFVNKLIFNTFICHKKSPGFSGKWADDPVCLDKDQDPVIPLTATAVMRMQTPLLQSTGYYPN